MIMNDKEVRTQVVTRPTSRSHQDLVVRHSVCSQAAAVKGDAVGGGAGVHRIDLPGEQSIVDASESSCGTKRREKRTKSELYGVVRLKRVLGHPHLCSWE